MASVELTRVWLHDEADLSDFVTLKARGIEASPARDVKRRRYAGGRVRAISTQARFRTVSFEAVQVSRDTLAWLDDRLGSLLMYRDPRGRVWWGFIADLPTEEQLWTTDAWLQLTFQAVTYDQAV